MLPAALGVLKFGVCAVFARVGGGKVKQVHADVAQGAAISAPEALKQVHDPLRFTCFLAPFTIAFLASHSNPMLSPSHPCSHSNQHTQ